MILAFAVLGLLGATCADVRWLQLVSAAAQTRRSSRGQRAWGCSAEWPPCVLPSACVGQYLVMLTVLFVWELIFILVSALGYGQKLGQLSWDIALCALLALVSSEAQH